MHFRARARARVPHTPRRLRYARALSLSGNRTVSRCTKCETARKNSNSGNLRRRRDGKLSFARFCISFITSEREDAHDVSRVERHECTGTHAARAFAFASQNSRIFVIFQLVVSRFIDALCNARTKPSVSFSHDRLIRALVRPRAHLLAPS